MPHPTPGGRAILGIASAYSGAPARDDLGRRVLVIGLGRCALPIVQDVPSPARDLCLQLSWRQQERVTARRSASVRVGPGTERSGRSLSATRRR